MPFKCLGCSQAHTADAAILVGEARKYERLGDEKMKYLHLAKAIGSIREAEEQAVSEEHANQLREIRKRIEAAVASGLPIPAVEEELTRKAAEMLEELSRHPELCPTCQRAAEGEIDHE